MIQINNKILISSFLFATILLVGAGCGKQDVEPDTTTPTTTPVVIKQPTKPADPADAFCKDNGHELIIRFDQETQSSKSFCRFADLSECNANDFYTGDCSTGEGTLPEQTSQKEDINIFTACGTEYEPVCGQNGITYTNSCLTQIQGIVISHEGACIAGKTTIAPIADSKSKTPTQPSGEEEDSFSDLPPTIDTSMPSWMGVVKDFTLSSTPNSPRAFIEKCNYNGTIYYFQSDGCTDCFSILYNEGGNSICYPNGDLGNECPGSFSNKNRPGCTRIWTDDR